VFDHNVQLADEVRKIAAQKGVTAPQVALGWALDHSKKDGGPEIIALPGATTSERVEENMAPAALDEKDMAVIDDILKKIEVKGARYPPGAEGQDD
jgi:pyridoxine 4-dehydrogenase